MIRKASSRGLLILLLALLAGPWLLAANSWAGPKVQSDQTNDLLARVVHSVDTHVLPTLNNLALKSKQLTNAIEMHCSSADIASLKVVEGSFAELVEAWAAARHLRFGPLRDAGRVARFHFWPDPRGVTARQMRRVFHAHNAELLDIKALRKQSVAVQGLGAAEAYLLFEKDAFSNGSSQRSDDYECLYTHGVARLMEREAEAVHTEWVEPGGWRERLTTPSSENEIYRSAKESAAQLVKALLLGLELVREQNIVPLYDLSSGAKKRAKVPFQRLGLNDESVRASLASLKQLNDALSLTDYGRGRTAWIKNWNAKAFDSLVRTSNKYDVPAKTALTPDDFDTPTLRQMRFYTNAIRQVIARQAAPSAGLTIGFNELDGD